MKPIVINKDQIDWLVSGTIFGQMKRFKSVRIQALCCNIAESNQIDFISAGLVSLPQVLSSSKKIAAFRAQEKEGFDDSGEVGLGLKLLTLLKQMNRTDLVLVVCIWDDGMPLKYGFDMFGFVLKTASELLIKHSEMLALEGRKQPKSRGEVSVVNVQFQGDEYKFQPATVVVREERDRFQPISLEMYTTAVRKLDESLRVLHPSDFNRILTTRSSSELSLVCICFCTLFGVKNPSWPQVRELLSSPDLLKTMKTLDIRSIRPALIRQVRTVLRNNEFVTVLGVMRVSPAAANVLKWCEAVVTIYVGLKEIERVQMIQQVSKAGQTENEPMQDGIDEAELRDVVHTIESKREIRRDPVIDLMAEETIAELRKRKEETSQEKEASEETNVVESEV